MSLLSKFRRYKEIVVVSDYSFSGGGSRPIYAYYRHRVSRGDKDILLLRLVTRHSYLKLLLLCLFKNRLVVNGISAFYAWPVHVACFLKKNTVVYLHEAAPHVEPFRHNHPLLHRSFRWALAHRKIAFVSAWQEAYFRDHYRLGATTVLYNAMHIPPQVPQGGVHIVMIAYQTEYKNVDFFSQFADYSAAHGKAYHFHWVGGDGGDTSPFYHSPNVTWWGDQDQVLDILDSFDVLLFTSRSDTFGLVIAEALYKGKRVVSYKENGLADHLRELGGCRVFETFDEAAVLQALEEALAEPVDVDANQRLVRELCSVENLEGRLNALFAASPADARHRP